MILEGSADLDQREQVQLKSKCWPESVTLPMAVSPVHSRSYFASSGGVPVNFEKEVFDGTNGGGSQFASGEAFVGGTGPPSNGAGGFTSSGLKGRSFPRVSMLPPEKLSSFQPDQPSSQPKLERSKSDRTRDGNLLPEEEAQFFDEEVPVQQKVKSLYTRQSLRE